MLAPAIGRVDWLAMQASEITAHILAVDDDPSVRKMIADYLGDNDMRVTALASGRDVAALKPESCRHWPLVLMPRRGSVRITVHPSAERIGCVAPRADLPEIGRAHV